MLHRLQVFYPLWSSSLWLRWMLGLKTALFWKAVMISEDGFPNLNPCNRFEQGGIVVVCLDSVLKPCEELQRCIIFSNSPKNIQIITKRYLSHGRSYALVSLEIRYWSWHQRINHHQPLTYQLRMCCILAPIFGLAVPRWLLRKRANWPGVKHWWQGDGGRWWLASWFWTKRCLGDGVGVGGFWSQSWRVWQCWNMQNHMMVKLQPLTPCAGFCHMIAVLLYNPKCGLPACCASPSPYKTCRTDHHSGMFIRFDQLWASVFHKICRWQNKLRESQVTGVMKWLGPAWFVLMPFLTLVMPYIGVNQAFMMIGSTTNR